MSNQLYSGQGRDINVPAGQSLAVSSITGAYTATIIAGAGIGTALATDSTGGATYGPYSGGVTVRLKAGEGALLDYEAAVSPVLNYAGPARLGHSAAGDTSSLVDGSGITWPIPRIIGQGLDIAGSRTITGSTTEISVYQLTIPGGSMSATGSLRISFLWSMTNNGNSKTVRVKFGNSGPMTFTSATNSIVSIAGILTIQNMGAVNSQEAHGSLAASLGPTGTVLNTAAIDTSVNQLLEFTLQLASGSDTASLRRVLVELINP